MGIKRIIDTDFWTDGKVVDLFSPEDKLFFLYLLTNPHTTQLGIYQVSKKVMAFEIGYSTEAVSVLLERFEKKYGVIKYSPETNEVAIKNYLRHSIIKGGKPVENLLLKEIAKVKDKKLLKYISGNLGMSEDLNETVQKVLSIMNDNENENDNENDCIVTDSVTIRGTNRKHTKKALNPPTLEEVKAYIIEKKYSVNAEDWYAYYESLGWKSRDGKDVIKNWKNYVVTWNNQEKRWQNNRPQKKLPDFTLDQPKVEEKQFDEDEWRRFAEEVGLDAD